MSFFRMKDAVNSSRRLHLSGKRRRQQRQNTKTRFDDDGNPVPTADGVDPLERTKAFLAENNASDSLSEEFLTAAEEEKETEEEDEEFYDAKEDEEERAIKRKKVRERKKERLANLDVDLVCSPWMENPF
jgi:hypothetical protein